ncbi:uncharacterized protein LOC134536348 [Bacillus rossius redtenbacheri]|uniref:uncharacterized protein LOC134536348 n=1 Tax=Bacillus rossius redtenbacheri TaxID=93214 RepID=UPI002FDEE0DC
MGVLVVAACWALALGFVDTGGSLAVDILPAPVERRHSHSHSHSHSHRPVASLERELRQLKSARMMPRLSADNFVPPSLRDLEEEGARETWPQEVADDVPADGPPVDARCAGAPLDRELPPRHQLRRSQRTQREARE